MQAQLFSKESQTDSAQRMYDARAAKYEDSWHPDYSRRLIDLIEPQPGARVLVLACGTGLDAFLAAERVGPTGMVVGVDISCGMLAEARERQGREEGEGVARARVQLLRHDVTDLESSGELAALGMKGEFDLLVCSCAFVLFEGPAGVVRGWRGWVKPGGVVAVDVTHEKNLIQGIVVERVARRMGVKWPSNRLWIKGRESFAEILEGEGFVVERIEFIDKVAGLPVTHYRVDQADEQFDMITNVALASSYVWEGADQDRARALFREEWGSIAVDGLVEVVDGLYLYIARKPR